MKLNIKIKRQRGQWDCGAAVVSMLTGLSLAQARDQLGMIPRCGCFMADIKRVLSRHGLVCEASSEISSVCVLRLNHGHFVLRCDSMTLDPATGTSKQLPSGIVEILAVT